MISCCFCKGDKYIQFLVKTVESFSKSETKIAQREIKSNARIVLGLRNSRHINIERAVLDDELYDGTNNREQKNEEHSDAEGNYNNLGDDKPSFLVE